MNNEEFTSRYHAEMADVHVSPQLKRKTLDALEGKENVVMKKKLSAALVLVIAIFLIGAVALAAANRAGILDFAGRYADAYVPEDAQAYVQTDVLTMENELVTAALTELYYDGRTARMTVAVTPKDPQTMLLGTDMALEDKWQNMTNNMGGEWNDSDIRTPVDVYQEGGYASAYSVNIWLPHEEGIVRCSMDYTLSEDGTLTLYYQMEYETDQDQRETMLRVSFIPYDEPLWLGSKLLPDEKIALEAPLVLNAAGETERYVSTEPADFPSVGVRVDQVLIEVKAQEIYATIDYTITDREVYNALDDGLWFEFIDPESTADQPYDQRLQGGLTGSGSIGPSDGKDLETAVHFRQTETLGRNELHDTYTLRAYDAWEKDRFETHTFTMQKMTNEK